MRLRTLAGRWLLGFAALGWTGADPSAQESEREGRSDTAEASIFDTTAAGRISNVFGGRLRPELGGVVSGGGIGVGVSYDVLSRARWRATTTAMITLNRYWSLDFDAEYQATRLEVAGYARIRDMSRLNYFGPGPNSLLDNRTTFRLRDPVIGGIAAVRIVPSVSLGGRIEALWPSVGPGRSPDFPSIEERFDEPTAPGLTAPPRLGRYQVFVDVEVPAAAAGTALQQGSRYRATYTIVDSPDMDRFTFRRVDLEGEQRFVGIAPHHGLTLHSWVSMSQVADGHEIPFFLQPTLGGRGHLWSMYESRIGIDGTRATLRGFRSFRFRDPNLLLLQAEYRVPVWGPVETTLFVDAGHVAGRPRDLNLSDVRRNYGFGVRLLRGRATAARMDVGMGGGEGVRVLVLLGNFVP
jgi:hypothetical protein